MQARATTIGTMMLLALHFILPALGASLLSVNEQAVSKATPVSQVVKLLKEMQEQLEKEADEDEEVYEKLACWCETNDKAKTKAIADAEAKISELTATIEHMTALSQTLNVEIKNLDEEIAKNKDSLEKATALRQKQLAEFNAEEKEMLQSISALKSAIVVLSKHHASAALPETMAKAIKVAQAELQKHRVLLQGTILPHQRRMLTAFQQEEPDYSDAKPTFKQAYKPQSGEIFGILKQMKETFEMDLSDSQKEELANRQAYEDLKKAKETEIATGEEALAAKKQQLADTDERLVQAKEDKEDTTASLSADQKFLMELKQKCSLTDSEWEERQKMRNEEMAAVSKAIAILSGDDARDLFSRTFNPASFIQKQMSLDAHRRSSVVSLLKKVAFKINNPKLAALAVTARLDSFTKVKEAIDKMVEELLQEKAQEIEHRDFCINGLNENERTNAQKVHEKTNLESSIEGLKLNIKQLADSIETLNAEITDLETELKRAGEDRAAEHKVFSSVVADQRETQQMLEGALTVLKRVYTHMNTEFIQQGTKRQEPPPPGFGEYTKQEGSTGVIMLIQQVIADTKAMEAETMHDETKAQEAYEDYVKDTNASIQAKRDGITNKSVEKAQAEQDLTAAESELDGVMGELQTLSNDEAALHKSCDYILKNFDVRQQARDEEVDALRQAKAILSGMK